MTNVVDWAVKLGCRKAHKCFDQHMGKSTCRYHDDPPVIHKFKMGDKVIFTNIFGVCWGVRTITELDERTNEPTYHYVPTDTPWFSTNERNLTLAEPEDLTASAEFLQKKYGFTPTEWFGCY